MDQYQQMNAVEKIEGYLIPRPNEELPAAFERAKAECLKHLREQVGHVENITVEQFVAGIE